MIRSVDTRTQAPWTFSQNGIKEARLTLDWTKCAAVESV